MASGDNTPPTADRNPNWRAVVSTLWPGQPSITILARTWPTSIRRRMHWSMAGPRFDNCFSLRVTAKYDWLARYHNWFCRQVQPLDDSLLLGDTEPMLYFRSLADDDGT